MYLLNPFQYPGNGKDVYVCGTFSDWKKIPMVKSQKDFVALIDLPVGEHQYKETSIFFQIYFCFGKQGVTLFCNSLIYWITGNQNIKFETL